MTESASTFRPENDAQLIDAIAWANSDLKPLELVGSGSKRALGRPVQAAHCLDLSAFAGITLYEPEELVLGAGTATPMADILAVLEEKKQELAFEPPDFGPLLGRPAGEGTLGGLLSSNLSGPRRIKAGAVRDHFLGFDAVSGRGQAFKSGGRVVKNVTGYDLSKLLCGSWGTIGAMTAAVVKVLPRSEKTRTVLVRGLDPEAAVKAMSDALNSPYELSGASWVPSDLTTASDVGYVRDMESSVTAFRLEGFGPSVEYRCGKLRADLAPLGETEELHSHNSLAFWAWVRDVKPFGQPGDERVVWRLSVAPTDAPAVLARLHEITGAAAFLDWAGGLIWLALPHPKTGAEELVRGALRTGGHATLIRGPKSLRAAVPVFQPQSAAAAALSRRVKESFDPNRLLNPGRMYEGV